MAINASNAIFMLSVAGLFPSPQQLQGFAADDVFASEPLQSAETLMGVDGKLSGGFVFVEFKQSITLQSDSDSNFVFDQWWEQQQVSQNLFPATGIITLPAIQTKYFLTNGFLTSYSVISDAKKLLQPRKFGITWERVSPAVT